LSVVPLSSSHSSGGGEGQSATAGTILIPSNLAPAISPSSPRSSFDSSDSSADEGGGGLGGGGTGVGVAVGGGEQMDTDDSVTCLWDDCGKVYTHLPTLVEHIHEGISCSLRVEWKKLMMV